MVLSKAVAGPSGTTALTNRRLCLPDL